MTAEGRGVVRPLVAHPTGSGKTIMFTHLIKECQQARALILVHREELVTQTVEKLAMVTPGLQVGVVKAERNDVAAPVVVGSVQTLQRLERLNPILPRDLLIVDEAHHASMHNMWYRIMLASGCFPHMRTALCHDTPDRGLHGHTVSAQRG